MTNSIDHSYPKQYRLLKPYEFKAVFDAPTRKLHQSHLMAFIHEPADRGHNQAKNSQETVTDPDLTSIIRDYPRLGMAITKKKVPTAVARNRVKRLIREHFRSHRAKLQPIDIVFIIKRPLNGVSDAQLKNQIGAIFQKLIHNNGKHNHQS